MKYGESPLIYGFGSSISAINTDGHGHVLRILAECLAMYGSRLHLNGPLTPDQAEAAGFGNPNVQENPGVAEVVIQETPAALAMALERLQDPAHRQSLGEMSLRKGREHFPHETAWAKFTAALLARNAQAESPRPSAGYPRPVTKDLLRNVRFDFVGRSLRAFWTSHPIP